MATPEEAETMKTKITQLLEQNEAMAIWMNPNLSRSQQRYGTCPSYRISNRRTYPPSTEREIR
jgi:hypothetical protein